MAYALDALPDCAALATPSNDWQWRNPTTSAPMLGDHSGEWLKGQLIALPQTQPLSQHGSRGYLMAPSACSRLASIRHRYPPS